MSQRIKEVLVPVDGSEGASRATRFAVDMASSLGASVRLFYVFPSASVEVIGMAAGMSRADIDTTAQTAAQRAFDKARAVLDDDLPVDLQEETSIGDPADEIVRYTEDSPDIMVIMGRRGLSRMKSLVLGSVSDKVSRHTKSPIMIIS
ncbi:MAG TPA: universal stress protein [Wenzhouxiangella sp.]|nr:universal stress protein [Wenzhouxiangella sp.]